MNIQGGTSLTGMRCVPVGTTTLGGGVWDTLGGGAECNGGNGARVMGGRGGATCTLGSGARMMGGGSVGMRACAMRDDAGVEAGFTTGGVMVSW